MSARYWCHMCLQTVSPVIVAEIICPFCHNGFVEEMSGELSDGSSSTSVREEVQDSEIDFGTDPALALWGPILLGMMSNPGRRTTRTELGLGNDEVNVAPAADADGNESNVDTHHHHHNRRRHHHRHMHNDSIIRRRRRSAAEIAQLLRGLREAINTEGVSTGLAHLLEQLADNPPIRHGTPPARKEAVENLPTVKICEPLQCSVCLDDFQKGSEAKEMPCKHKFHVGCIVPWLDLHSSCPVCRYELTADGVVKTDLVTPGTTSVEINRSNENVEEEDARNTTIGSERSWFSLPWPFSGLFSSSASSSGSASSGSSQLNENSSSA